MLMVVKELLDFSMFISIQSGNPFLCMDPNILCTIVNINGSESSQRLLDKYLIYLGYILAALETRTIRKIVHACSLRGNSVCLLATVLSARSRPISTASETLSISMKLTWSSSADNSSKAFSHSGSWLRIKPKRLKGKEISLKLLKGFREREKIKKK